MGMSECFTVLTEVKRGRLDVAVSEETLRSPEELVARLQSEKRHLFGRASEPATARKTSGVRDRAAPGRSALEQAAAKAARTGKRADLQEYLRLRRNVL